uniref:HAP1 N-terminal domain-containing protein n=1 Tax=Heterorhabditis bacteriophora TaxID=37862 RepID=A0A1I7W843_HETBA
MSHTAFSIAGVDVLPSLKKNTSNNCDINEKSHVLLSQGNSFNYLFYSSLYHYIQVVELQLGLSESQGTSMCKSLIKEKNIVINDLEAEIVRLKEENIVLDMAERMQIELNQNIHGDMHRYNIDIFVKELGTMKKMLKLANDELCDSIHRRKILVRDLNVIKRWPQNVFVMANYVVRSSTIYKKKLSILRKVQNEHINICVRKMTKYDCKLDSRNMNIFSNYACININILFSYIYTYIFVCLLINYRLYASLLYLFVYMTYSTICLFIIRYFNLYFSNYRFSYSMSSLVSKSQHCQRGYSAPVVIPPRTLVYFICYKSTAKKHDSSVKSSSGVSENSFYSTGSYSPELTMTLIRPDPKPPRAVPRRPPAATVIGAINMYSPFDDEDILSLCTNNHWIYNDSKTSNESATATSPFKQSCLVGSCSDVRKDTNTTVDREDGLLEDSLYNGDCSNESFSSCVSSDSDSIGFIGHEIEVRSTDIIRPQFDFPCPHALPSLSMSLINHGNCITLNESDSLATDNPQLHESKGITCGSAEAKVCANSKNIYSNFDFKIYIYILYFF